MSPQPRPTPSRDFDALFEAACERVLLYVRLRLSPALAQRVEPLDVLQETWIEAARSIGEFEERGAGSFERWLCRVAENRLRDLAKHHGALKRRPPGAPLPVSRLLERARASATGPLSAAQRREEHGRLAAALEQLAPEERDALVLRHFQGATVAEIACALGRSETATRRLLGRAVARAGSALGAGKEGGP